MSLCEAMPVSGIFCVDLKVVSTFLTKRCTNILICKCPMTQRYSLFNINVAKIVNAEFI